MPSEPTSQETYLEIRFSSPRGNGEGSPGCLWLRDPSSHAGWRGFLVPQLFADQRVVAGPNASSADEVRSPIERLLRYLDKIARGGFFGKVVVSFQNGRVCDVKIEQTKKLDEL